MILKERIWQIMKNILKKISAVGLSTVMAAGMLAGCGAKDEAVRMDGSKIVTTINDEEIPLGVVSFYAKYQQAYLSQMYTAYFGTTDIFDTPADSSSEQTYGEQMRDSVLKSVEDMVVISHNAEMYGVFLEDDELKKIEEVAQAYINENSEEVRAEVGASYDDVVKLLKLQTIQSKMYEPLGEEVDQNVTDEEAKQSTVSYVAISKDTASTSTTSSAESTESTAASEDASLEKAEKVLAALQSESDPKTADLTTVAQTVDSALTASTGQFSANDTTDTYLDASIVEAVSGLKEGEVVDKVLENEAKTTYYVVRFDKEFDKEATESKKESILSTRKSDHYTEVVEKWRGEAKITRNEEVLKTLVISDTKPVTLVQDPVDSTASATESAPAAESHASAAESAESASAESKTESAAASNAESKAESGKEAAESK